MDFVYNWTVTDLSSYGPWAVIAGGSEGVGRSFALQLAQAGLNLVLIARKPVALEETAALCREHGVEGFEEYIQTKTVGMPA